MAQQFLTVRFGLSLIAAGLLTGCHFSGQERNPAFRNHPRAEEPTVVVAPVSCRSTSPSHAGNEFTSQYRILVKTQIHTAFVDLDPEQHSVICGTLGKDFGNVISLTGPSEKDWRTSGALTAVVQEIATRNHAKSVYLPLASFSTNCNRDEARLKDERGNTIATVDKGTVSCEESTGAMLRSYLFTAEGQIEWKSWAVVRSNDAGKINDGVAQLLLGVPASFSKPVEGAAPPLVAPVAAPENTTATAPPPSKDVEAVLGKMDAKAPPVCRAYLRALCEGSVAATRVTMCQSFVNAMRPLTISPSAAAGCESGLRDVRAKTRRDGR